MNPIKAAVLLLVFAMSSTSLAQSPERRPGEGRPGEPGRFGGGQEGFRGRMPNPLMEALDKDRNGELSADEIEHAAESLKTLDRNSDGKLDGTELRPNFEAMGRGGFAGPGPGGPGGPGAGMEEMVARMMAMDANKDGKLQKDELPERLQSMLTRGDKNEDGSLDKAELEAGMARMRGGREGGFGGPGDFRGPGGPRRGQRPPVESEDGDGKKEPAKDDGQAEGSAKDSGK